MKLRNVKNLFIVTVLAPTLGGLAMVGCDDDGTDNSVDAMANPDALPTEGGSSTDTNTDGPSTECQLEEVPVTENVAANTTWGCKSYLLKKMIYVTNNAVLTIKPGVKVMADTDAPLPRPGLIVARGSKLIANGTKTAPIVFTSANAPGARVPGDFAGVALLGSARLNSGDSCVGGTGDCAAPAYFNRHIEGLQATDPLSNYGGNDDAGSCGELSYVRIEFAGAVLAANNELNGLTLAGCGSATKVSYLQVHRGKDDGVEIFGGAPNLDHILVTADEDDGLDWDFGWRGSAQFVIIHKWADAAKSSDPNGFEGDNAKDAELVTPVSAPKIYNATLIGNTGYWGMTLRRGTRATIRNIIEQGFAGSTANIGWTNAAIVPANEWPAQLSVENSFFWMNGPYLDATVAAPLTSDDLGFDEKAAFEDAARKNQFAMNPGITSVIETAPNYTPAATVAGQAVPPAPLDATATYAGAVAPGAVSWTEGWTSYPVN